MNTTLAQLEKWLSELGITCQARPTCLMVSRDGIANFGTNDEILAEIKTSISKRVFISYRGTDVIHLDCI